jgi:Uma2 family endonuclease
VSATLARKAAAPPFLIPDLVPDAYRFTVEQYHLLGDAAILTPEDRVELIDGWIREKPVQKTPHASAMTRLQNRLPRLIPANFAIRSQLPITLATSEPEPDVVVARGSEEQYDDNHPGPGDVALVVEVSDTSLDFDRGPKLLLYADARVPAYWVVNIPDQRVEVSTRPRRGRTPNYRTRTDYPRGSKVPIVLDGVTVGEIAVNDILRG